MNHYCTCLDQNYLLRGIALWISLERYDPGASLWILCLDPQSANACRLLKNDQIRVITLQELELAEPALLSAKTTRTWVEYIFTLSPCWPLYLLEKYPQIEVLTYVDADMAFFSSPALLYEELNGGNLLLVEHRFPEFLKHCETRGRFNVGVLCYRNNVEARACLKEWKGQCLEWCYDRVEADRYADQKYLDRWPERFSGVIISQNPGINLAPWNWMQYSYKLHSGRLLINNMPLMVFHFARFKKVGGWLFSSGQLEYGVMPFLLRSWIYSGYFSLLGEASTRLSAVAPELSILKNTSRGTRALWKTLILEFIFGPTWLRMGRFWVSGGFGLGRFSGFIQVIGRRLLR